MYPADMNSSSDPLYVYFCSTSEVGPSIMFAFSIVKGISVLPLSILVLYLGLQRRRKEKSFRSLSHSDVFTYHLAAVELFWGPGLICYVCGSKTNLQSIDLLAASGGIYTFTFYGEAFFHSLTCVDRYLAVVHPIVYLQLKNSRGMKIRNISISCAWILSFGLVCFYMDLTGNSVINSILCFVAFPIIIITFFSLSVLCALIRPGPGEGGGEKERVDQLKRRAFYTITAILGVLCLWFLGLLLGTAVTQSPQISAEVRCLVFCSITLFSFPTSLVSPLLYLHRSGKRLFISRNRK